MASTASAKSLASTPVVCTHSASTPANGPSPTATMNSIAKTISLIARHASITRRIGCTIHIGAMLCADINPHGTAHTSDSAVPHTATDSVTIISCR